MKRKMGEVSALGLGVGVAQGCGKDISSVAGRKSSPSGRCRGGPFTGRGSPLEGLLEPCE